MRLIKRIAALAALASVALFTGHRASAQYWEAANQLTNLISPALSGSGAYKGSVELMGVAGIGDNKLNQVEIATSQGYQYNSWFYMGAGLGVGVVHSGNDPWAASDRYYPKRTGVMIPVFSDFRFTIPMGGDGGSAMFVDLRLGASWLCGDKALALGNDVMTTSTNFYFRPAIGARFPINGKNSKQAVNIGLAYLLLTANNGYWYNYQTPTLSALGATVSFEW